MGWYTVGKNRPFGTDGLQCRQSNWLWNKYTKGNANIDQVNVSSGFQDQDKLKFGNLPLKFLNALIYIKDAKISCFHWQFWKRKCASNFFRIFEINITSRLLFCSINWFQWTQKNYKQGETRLLYFIYFADCIFDWDNLNWRNCGNFLNLATFS